MQARTWAIFVLGALAIGIGSRTAADDAARDKEVERELRRLDEEWTQAMAKRDPARLSKVLADDYEGVVYSGELWNKDKWLAVLKSGDLAVESGENAEWKIKVYGDSAVVRSRGNIKGKYRGQDISGSYRWTDFFVKRDGRWQCVASQETRIAGK